MITTDGIDDDDNDDVASSFSSFSEVYMPLIQLFRHLMTTK